MNEADDDEPENLRRVYRKSGDRWDRVQMRDIRKGDVFRMQCDDIADRYWPGRDGGRTAYTAESDAFELEGVWRVQVTDYVKEVG